jgi:tetratricopeptide (TPR) repeat protein
LKAKAYGKLGKHHDKILAIEEAIKLNPSIGSYHRNLGSAYYNIERYELAIEEYNKAIEL